MNAVSVLGHSVPVLESSVIIVISFPHFPLSRYHCLAFLVLHVSPVVHYFCPKQTEPNFILSLILLVLFHHGLN